MTGLLVGIVAALVVAAVLHRAQDWTEHHIYERHRND